MRKDPGARTSLTEMYNRYADTPPADEKEGAQTSLQPGADTSGEVSKTNLDASKNPADATRPHYRTSLTERYSRVDLK